MIHWYWLLLTPVIYGIGILHQCARESARRSRMRRQISSMRQSLEVFYNQDLA